MRRVAQGNVIVSWGTRDGPPLLLMKRIYVGCVGEGQGGSRRNRRRSRNGRSGKQSDGSGDRGEVAARPWAKARDSTWRRCLTLVHCPRGCKVTYVVRIDEVSSNHRKPGTVASKDGKMKEDRMGVHFEGFDRGE